MDLQKEREAFELVVANQLQNSLYHSVFFNEATGLYDCADDAPAGVQVFCFDLNSDWRIWKAAKAQAVQEGFVLVEREKLAMIFETATNALVYHAAPPKHDALSIIQGIARKAMIEAQEPAND